MHSFLTSFVLALSLFVQSAVSQESTAAPTTTGNIDISREVLAAKLSPMPLARIEVEVQGWMDLLVATNTKISENKIAELGGSPNADLKSRLIAEQDKAVRGLGAALEAMKALGGDPANYEKYIAASSGLDLSDASGFSCGSNVLT